MKYNDCKETTGPRVVSFASASGTDSDANGIDVNKASDNDDKSNSHNVNCSSLMKCHFKNNHLKHQASDEHNKNHPIYSTSSNNNKSNNLFKSFETMLTMSPSGGETPTLSSHHPCHRRDSNTQFRRHLKSRHHQQPQTNQRKIQAYGKNHGNNTVLTYSAIYNEYSDGDDGGSSAADENDSLLGAYEVNSISLV